MRLSGNPFSSFAKISEATAQPETYEEIRAKKVAKLGPRPQIRPLEELKKRHEELNRDMQSKGFGSSSAGKFDAGKAMASEEDRVAKAQAKWDGMHEKAMKEVAKAAEKAEKAAAKQAAKTEKAAAKAPRVRHGARGR